MSRQFWIRIRLLGWVLMLAWFLFYEVNVLLNLFTYQLINAMNGIFGAAGTFAVLVGYYMLVKDDA
jgi:hypothetical protein